MEEWRDVVGYEGLYKVSSLGRVKSLNYRNTGKEQILKPYKNNYGYLIVNLSKGGKERRALIHRLVAHAFIPNPYNLQFVNHKDENKLNNCVENLEWCDQGYNNRYGTRTERMAKKLSKPVMCVDTCVIYPSVHEAERDTGTHYQNIIKCCRGKRNIAGGFHWRYVE